MADKHESTMQWKLDIDKFKVNIQDAKREISLANAEFKTATAGAKYWADSVTGCEAKIKQLTQTSTNQKRILGELEKQYAVVAKEMGEDSAEAQRLKIEIENQKAAIAKTERQIGEYNNKLDALEKENKEANSALGKLNSTIEDQEDRLEKLKKQYQEAVLQYGKNSDEAKELASQIKTLSSKLKENKEKLADAEEAADEFDESLEDVEETSGKASEGFTIMKGALANLVADGIRAAISAMKDLAKQTFNAGSSFESSMANVAAISGATGDDLDALTEKAKEMGSQTKFTAGEAADAFSYMAMAGWDTADMLNGIEGVMDLAAASGEDLASVSDIVTDALTAMGYKAGDAGKLADVMAAASSNANTNVSLMGATFQYAAPIIGALGYSMEDAAVAIGLMANAGIKGQKAGTALRSILTRLSAPPKECAEAMDALGISLTDSSGNMKSMDEVMQDLRKAFSKLSETEQTAYAKQIAGQEAMSGLLSIVRSAPADYNKLTEAVRNSTGASKQMADTMNDTVSGQITLLKSKVEGIMIKVFENASGAIRKAIDTVSNTLDKVDWDKFGQKVGNIANKIADFFAYVVDHGDQVVAVLKSIAVAFVTYQAVSIISSVVGAFQGLFSAIKAGQGVMSAFTGALSMSPLGLAAGAIGGLVTLFVSLKDAAGDSTKELYTFTDAEQKVIDKIQEQNQAWEDSKAARKKANDAIETSYSYYEELWKRLDEITNKQGGIKTGYIEEAEAIMGELSEGLGVEFDLRGWQISNYQDIRKEIDKVIAAKKAEALLSANQQYYTDAILAQKDAYATYNEQLAETNRLGDELEAAYRRQAKAYEEATNGKVAMWDDYENETALIEELTAKYAAQQQNLEDAKEGYLRYTNVIENYDGLMTAVANGDVEALSQAMANLTNDFVTAENATKSMLENQLANFKEQYANMQQMVRNGMPGVTQAQVDEMGKLVEQAEAELNKLEPKAKESTQKAGKAAAKGLDSTINVTNNAAARTRKGMTDELGKANTEQIGKNKGNEYASGVKSTAGTNNQVARGVASSAVDGFGAIKANNAGKAHGDQHAAGIKSTAGVNKQAGQAVANESKSGAESVHMTQSGKKAGDEYSEGIKGTAGTAKKNAQSVANSGVSGFNSVSARNTGVAFAQGFSGGISSMTSSIKSVASRLASNAVSAMKRALNSHSPSKVTQQIGVDFGEGYEIGIDSMISSVRRSAENMAKGTSKALASSQIFDGLQDQLFSADIAANVTSAVGNLKAGVSAANNFATGRVQDTYTDKTTNKQQIVNFNQTINSPKAIDRLTIYRETNSMLFGAKVRLNNV